MSPEAAYVFWIAGEVLFVLFGAFAVWSIARDVRTAWPRIVKLFTQEEPEE